MKWAVGVAQSAEWSNLTLEDIGSNPAITLFIKCIYLLLAV